MEATHASDAIAPAHPPAGHRSPPPRTRPDPSIRLANRDAWKMDVARERRHHEGTPLYAPASLAPDGTILVGNGEDTVFPIADR